VEQDGLMRGLAWLHPTWMVVGLWLAFRALRVGIELRRGRLRGVRREPALRRRHLRLARPAVVMLLLGFVGGPASALWLRDWSPFETFHAWLGLLAVLLFTSAAGLGSALVRGRSREVEVHGRLGVAALLAAAVAAVAGFVLLP
jgi:hypothetical protein